MPLFVLCVCHVHEVSFVLECHMQNNLDEVL